MPEALSNEQIEQYHRDGYVPRLRVVSEDRAAEFRRQMEAAEFILGQRIKVGEKLGKLQ